MIKKPSIHKPPAESVETDVDSSASNGAPVACSTLLCGLCAAKPTIEEAVGVRTIKAYLSKEVKATLQVGGNLVVAIEGRRSDGSAWTKLIAITEDQMLTWWNRACILVGKRLAETGEPLVIEAAIRQTCPTNEPRMDHELTTDEPRMDQIEERKPSQEEFAAAWNALGKPFPALRQMSPLRLKHFRARCRDQFWLDNWRIALAKLPESLFLRGDVNGWIAGPDFFLRPESVLKIIEGRYSNSKGPGNNGTPDLYAGTREWINRQDPME